MAYHGPDELVLQSIRELSQNLDIHSLEAVTHGLGVGKLRPSERQAKAVFATMDIPAVTPEMTLLTPTSATTSSVTAEEENKRPSIKHARAKKAPVAADGKTGRMAWLWVHMMDMSIVLLTLLIGLFFVNAFVLSPAPLSLKSLDKVIIFRLYRDLGALNLIAISYGVFVSYWLFFRLFAGMTLGETLFKQPRKIPKNSLQKENSKPLASI